MFLPGEKQIADDSIVHSQFRGDRRVWDHPVVVRAVHGNVLEICLCSSFSDGKTHESARPLWFSSAMVIWDGTGDQQVLPERGPKQTLAMREGMALNKKETWVRTDRTFRIEADNLKVFGNRKSMSYLSKSSAAALEAQIQAQTSTPARSGIWTSKKASVQAAFGTALSTAYPSPAKKYRRISAQSWR